MATGGATVTACYIGIDVSKDSSTAQKLDGKGNKLFYLEFALTAEGYAKLLRTIKAHCKDLSQSKAAMVHRLLSHKPLLFSCF